MDTSGWRIVFYLGIVTDSHKEYKEGSVSSEGTDVFFGNKTKKGVSNLNGQDLEL